MTSFRPYFRITRLLIFSKGKAAYDEAYHQGTNILRGENAHGKSTITDFIFFALGGDNTIWKEEALKCDCIAAEVEINDHVLTLRRYIGTTSKQPLHIFWGAYDEAARHATNGWEAFPYQRSLNKDSFSQKLFQLLDLPESRGDEGSMITMHQLLRLLYVDQVSPYDSLLRDENFDSALKREAIGDLMLGLYDKTIYEDQLELQNRTKELDQSRSEIRTLRHVFGELKIETDPKQISKAREQNRAELEKITEEMRAWDQALSTNSSNKILAEKGGKLEELKRSYSAVSDRLSATIFEIEDSSLFIKDLKARIEALRDSLATRKSIGTLNLEFCPICLSPIQEDADQSASHASCRLCKKDLGTAASTSQALRMLSELETQLRESTELLADREALVSDYKRQIRSVERAIETGQKELDETLSLIRSSRDQKRDELFQRNGSLVQRQDGLAEALSSDSVLTSSLAKEARLKHDIEKLRLSIEQKRKAQVSRQRLVTETISKIAVKILRQDEVEEQFKEAESVVIDWRNNTFSVDGRNNFSASSVVFARNAVHFAIFFASLELDFMRYPRFILSDCIEDKGMVPARSGNFQRIVSVLSSESQVRHQIIFTTSMIDPSLEGTHLCVGPPYIGGRKTLVL